MEICLVKRHTKIFFICIKKVNTKKDEGNIDEANAKVVTLQVES